MNRIYRLIRNNRTGTIVPVSENTKSTGKQSSSGTIVVGRSACLTLTALAMPLMLLLGANAYAALPTGGGVSAGGASISSGAKSVTITQTTPKVAINWQSFNIGQTESVQFVQSVRDGLETWSQLVLDALEPVHSATEPAAR